ncbi:hypothetical protein HGRIS_004167 [Hohenbuehelia grisea]|uniref:alpha-1,2-Mannosidase n=1 Tax=Hohenbuehelia grisea TaxID=104357 RepID=A0ABR3JIP5_9AGAR
MLPPASVRKYSAGPLDMVWQCLHHRAYSRNLLSAVFFLVILGGLWYTLIPHSQRSFGDLFGSGKKVGISPEQVSDSEWARRAGEVRNAFLHAWNGYERYALPHDELMPLSDKPIDNFNGWGVTLFDALDTMLLMGLKEEFKRALPVVERANFSMEPGKYAPFFETTIRYTGGLLSAHALSQESILLQRAEDLAAKLDPIFKTKSGFPLYAVNTDTGSTKGTPMGTLAELASLQLEYTYLAKHTGKKEYWNRANAVIQALAQANLTRTGGMFPIRWNLTSGQPLDYHMSVGAQADSAHEYLLKQHLLTGKTDKKNLEMYLRTTTYIISNLLYISPRRHLLYVTDTPSSYAEPGRPTHTLEHLSCFLPGLFALGAHTLPLDDAASMGIHMKTLHDIAPLARSSWEKISTYNLTQLHMWVAEGLAQTCYTSYADQPTGLGPEEMLFLSPGKDADQGTLWIDVLERWRLSAPRTLPPGVGDKVPVVVTDEQRRQGSSKFRDYALKKPGYLLRPETIESLYILWRVTGNAKWRDRGWKIFQAIEKQTKTGSGYASLKTVEHLPPIKDDAMPSYFLAETLKYLYLLFSTEDPVSLDKWVFNTEAHPLPIFQWTPSEREAFGV